MIYHVQFPGLGINLTVGRVAFSVGGLAIYWYGICIAAGLLLALWFAISKARSYGINSDRMIDVIMLSTVIAIICARAFYVAFAPFEYTSLWQMVNLRDGGIAIYGGVIGAFLAGWALSRWRKVPVLPMFDLASMGFLIGQGLGRWGNFFNQEAFGTNTSLPWGMYSEGTRDYLASVQATLAAEGVSVDPSLPVHPTFLYESIWCLLGFVLLLLYEKKRKFHGEIFLLYIIWYGAERFFVEGLRTDSLEALMGVRVSQLIAGVSVLAAFAVWLVLRKKYSGQKLMVTYPVVDKRLNGPAALVWEAGQTPSEEELKQRVEALVSERGQAEMAAREKEPDGGSEAAPAGDAAAPQANGAEAQESADAPAQAVASEPTAQQEKPAQEPKTEA